MFNLKKSTIYFVVAIIFFFSGIIAFTAYAYANILVTPYSSSETKNDEACNNITLNNKTIVYENTNDNGSINASTERNVSINPNDSITDSLRSTSETVYYNFTSRTNDGKISINFSHKLVSKSQFWEVKVEYYDKSTTKYEVLSDTNIKLSDGENIELPYIGTNKSYNYRISVSAKYLADTPLVGTNYTITTKFTSTDNYEKEPNNYYDTATSIKLNKTYQGNLNTTKDYDYYKINLNGYSGKLAIYFSHKLASSSSYWKVIIEYYNTTTTKYEQLCRKDIKLNDSENYLVLNQNVNKDIDYRIKISAGYLSDYPLVGTNYSIICNEVGFYKASINLNGGNTIGTAPSGWEKSGDLYTKKFNENTSYSTILNEWKNITISKGNAVFDGWSPSSGSLTNNTTFKATWVVPGTLYRLYNPNSGEHFYTSSAGERNYLANVGWRYEGIAWVSPVKSNTPVYRLYNPNSGDHHYTTSGGERNQLINVGWRDEGIGWYSDDAKKVPVYRQYNPNAFCGSHNFTISKSENDWLVKLGWRAEGIAWYAAG